MITGTFGCDVVSEEITKEMTKHNITFVSAFAGDVDSREPRIVVHFQAFRAFEVINFENAVKDIPCVNWIFSMLDVCGNY